MKQHELEFNFEGSPVGYFEEKQFPTKDGRYRYMPYRGPGHYELGVKLREAGCAECSYESGGEGVFFIVRSRPEYGVLELTAFRRAPVKRHGIRPVVEKYTKLPFNRLRVISSPADLHLPELRRTVIFVFAEWSGPAMMAFGTFTGVLSTLDLDSIDVVVLDIDCMAPNDVVRVFGHVFHGAGETLWVRDGRVCAELSAYGKDSERFIFSRTKALLDGQDL